MRDAPSLQLLVSGLLSWERVVWPRGKQSRRLSHCRFPHLGPRDRGLACDPRPRPRSPLSRRCSPPKRSRRLRNSIRSRALLPSCSAFYPRSNSVARPSAASQWNPRAAVRLRVLWPEAQTGKARPLTASKQTRCCSSARDAALTERSILQILLPHYCYFARLDAVARAVASLGRLRLSCLGSPRPHSLSTQGIDA